jgi:flavin-dependent dehydrogenase
MSHPDVVVLGGGVIGLACARELAEAGPWTARQIAALAISGAPGASPTPGPTLAAATSGPTPAPEPGDREILAAFSPARFPDLG